MLKKTLVKKVGLGLILCSTSLFSAVSHGVIIASYDTAVNIEVSSTFLNSTFETAIFNTDLFVEGSASGNANGSDNFGPVNLNAGEIGSLNATASGEVNGGQGLVDTFWQADGFLLIDNEFGADSITGDVSFDISWFASIFTDTSDEEAATGASIFIRDSFGFTIFDDFINFDSFFEGTGVFGSEDAFTVDVTGLTIAAGDFEEYFIEIDVNGFAQSFQDAAEQPIAEVPEPVGVFFAGLALLFAVRKYKTS